MDFSKFVAVLQDGAIYFNKFFSGPSDGIFVKRQSLAHENEVRVVVYREWLASGNPVGVRPKCNLAALFTKVVVSPFAQPWFQRVVEDVVKNHFGLSTPVVASELRDEPF
jgi:hypothetical protein